jgi:ornithine cyclodeaminase/alanine dehydrogenase-like protein (mu-crystallin family)
MCAPRPPGPCHLAQADARIAGVIGAGTQARLQMEALAKVRPIERILVWARYGAKADACADDLTGRLGLEPIAANSAGRLVLEADVVTTTPARSVRASARLPAAAGPAAPPTIRSRCAT